MSLNEKEVKEAVEIAGSEIFTLSQYLKDEHMVMHHDRFKKMIKTLNTFRYLAEPYLNIARKMPEKRKCICLSSGNSTNDIIHNCECGYLIYNQARQSCIFAFMKALPTDEAINDIIISICKELNPNFVGEIFIADNYYAPPNNWTRVSTLKIATAIHARLEKGVKNE